MYKLRNILFWVRRLFDLTDVPSSRSRELSLEFAERLLFHFGQSEEADNYLIKGIILVSDLDGKWSVRFSEYEVPSDTEQCGQELILNVPSPFNLFVQDRDWFRAYEIVKAHLNSFTTPGLAGWRAVTLANVHPEKAVKILSRKGAGR